MDVTTRPLPPLPDYADPFPLRRSGGGSPVGAHHPRDDAEDEPVLDPYPEDNRPSRRRPTISGRPFEPWLVAGDRLPPPGGYHFDAPGTRLAAEHAPEDETGTSRRGPGRPRNVDAERKAFAAVLDLFGQRGWAGLSLDAVAAEAGLGKSSIYLRWADKQELLLDALGRLDVSVLKDSAGRRPGVREMLVHAAHRRIEQYTGENGPALFRLNIEARIYPAVFEEIWQQTVGASIKDLTDALLDSVEGDHRPTEEDTTDLIASVEGTALYLTYLTHPEDQPGRQVLYARIERMVDRNLKAIRDQVAQRAAAEARERYRDI